MTNARKLDVRTPASRGELSDDQLAKASGGQHAIVSPRDASTGLSTGRRQHKPVA
jgi:hypothetical protein